MITIPTTIKYNKAIHFGDRVTKTLDLKKDSKFIRSVLSDLEKDHADAYVVKNARGQVIICRKRLVLAIINHPERHQFFALRNKVGKVITNGKNLRRPEAIIGVLKALFRRNSAKLYLLAKSHDLSVAERCELFGYELIKRDTPFE